MTASIIKAGSLYRWQVVAKGQSKGGECPTWEQALAETVKAGEMMAA